MNYYKTPRFIINVEKYYNNLSATDIILFTILYSINDDPNEEQLIDVEGEQYFIHTELKLSELLNSSRNTMLKSLKTLQEIQLIHFEKEDNWIKIYVKEPILTRNEIQLLKRVV